MNEEIKVFKAIADETRLKILILLSNKNICAKGMARQLNISEAAVSQHIKVLKEAELIIAYKKGYFVMYEINKSVLEKAETFINFLIHKDLSSLDNHYDIKLNELDITGCKSSCKSIKGCCKKTLKEE